MSYEKIEEAKRDQLRIRATQFLLDEGFAELFLDGKTPMVRLTRSLPEIHKALRRFKKND